MNSPSLFFGRSLALAASLLMCRFVAADTVVNFGTLTQIDNAGGLDLTGDIIHAINFSAEKSELTVNGVVFKPDTDPPVDATLVGPNEVSPWQTKPEFGDDPDNDALEDIFQDIRWANSALTQALEADLPVTAGQMYKLQVLFYGNWQENRRWDIEVEGQLAMDEVTSLGLNEGGQSPPYSPNAGLVFTHTLTVADATLNVRFVGSDAPNDGGDRNPIWQALTVEHVPSVVVVDIDADGLPDTWEITWFGNLSQNGTGDPDAEGLNNLGEFRLGTKPNDPDTDDDTLEDDVETSTGVFVSASNTGSSPLKPDTDSDGLSDSVEVNTHRTNPNRADSDSDTLSDNAEVTTHLTDPLKWDSDADCLSDGEEINTHQTKPRSADSDSDGVNDGIEALVSLTDPNDAGSKPDQVLSGLVCGGDEGEGLDLKGDFLYAVNIGPNGAAGLIQDADFTDDAAPGVTVTAQNQIPNFSNYNFGTTVNDTRLKTVMDSIRWTNANTGGIVAVELANIEPGTRYKLQLLFGEGCCAARGEDIIVEDVTVFHNFITAPAQGGQGNGRRGSVITYEFTAADNVLNISCDGPLADDPSLTDHNAILSGLTLEKLTSGPASSEFAITQVTKTGTSVTLNFRGKPTKTYAVDFSSALAVWTEVSDAVTTTAGGTGTFTDTNAARVGAALGHYRVRDPVLKPTP